METNNIEDFIRFMSENNVKYSFTGVYLSDVYATISFNSDEFDKEQVLLEDKPLFHKYHHSHTIISMSMSGVRMILKTYPFRDLFIKMRFSTDKALRLSTLLCDSYEHIDLLKGFILEHADTNPVNVKINIGALRGFWWGDLLHITSGTRSDISITIDGEHNSYLLDSITVPIATTNQYCFKFKDVKKLTNEQVDHIKHAIYYCKSGNIPIAIEANWDSTNAMEFLDNVLGCDIFGRHNEKH